MNDNQKVIPIRKGVELDAPTIFVMIEMGCGCAAETRHAVDSDDDPNDLIRAVADALSMPEIQEHITNGGKGHLDGGNDSMLITVTRGKWDEPKAS